MASLLCLQAGTLVVAACAPQTSTSAAVWLLGCAAASMVALWRVLAGERAMRRLEAERESDRQRAAEGVEAKNQFFANLTHEIRTPMTAILGFADVLLSQSVPEPERRRHLLTIRSAGNHLLTIVNDMLDLAKAEAGRMTVEQLEVSPSAVVADVLELLRGRADERGLTLTAGCEGPIPSVIHSDPVRLRQILLNLVSNAIRFTDQGGVTIVMSFDGERGSIDARLRFEVRDTGRGLRQDQIDRLFQPFAQADRSIARTHGGTGLGLAISAKLVTLLGGAIGVESVPGSGSTFHFSVATGSLAGTPFIEGLESASTRSELAAAIAVSGRVLLAEDSPDSQRLLGLHLRTLGLDVVVVEDGDKALRVALDGTESFDLVLLDVFMPGKGGPETLAELRRHGWGGPVLALTAGTDEAGLSRCAEAGFDEVLTKPIDRAGLAAACSRWLGAERNRREAA